ncbi:hypothetical protein HMPREF3216_01316 [Gardnerella vaginalis]|uniref:Uncharacterized protein n=1 Tax=Gardnerella vaginalis TaxID=2702 RepID=A0A133NLX6_GARVA|nr:hypothetical protein HMPREF3216_01316 [Gardnerella vaginalis]
MHDKPAKACFPCLHSNLHNRHSIATTASLVHPGSFCSASGAQEITIQGTLMMCKEGVNDGRLRCRKVR